MENTEQQGTGESEWSNLTVNFKRAGLNREK